MKTNTFRRRKKKATKNTTSGLRSRNWFGDIDSFLLSNRNNNKKEEHHNGAHYNDHNVGQLQTRRLIAKFPKGMEKLIDDVIEETIRLVKEYKRVLVAIALVVASIYYKSIVNYANNNVINPIADAVSSGITAAQFSTAIGLGISSGLSAPGLTMLALFGLAKVLSVFGFDVSAPVIAIAAALNVALTVPDLIVWNSVFCAIGGYFIKGGRYIR